PRSRTGPPAAPRRGANSPRASRTLLFDVLRSDPRRTVPGCDSHVQPSCTTSIFLVVEVMFACCTTRYRSRVPIDVNSEERLAQIAEATLRVVQQRGADGVTIRAVADE